MALKNYSAATEQQQTWTTEIGCLGTASNRSLYISIVADQRSNHAIGWALDSHIGLKLITDALMMAIRQNQPQREVVVRIDYSNIFRSGAWTTFLNQNNLVIHSGTANFDRYFYLSDGFLNELVRASIDRHFFCDPEDAREKFSVFAWRNRPRQRVGGKSNRKGLSTTIEAAHKWAQES